MKITFTYEQLVDFCEEYGGMSIRCNDEDGFKQLLNELAETKELTLVPKPKAQPIGDSWDNA